MVVVAISVSVLLIFYYWWLDFHKYIIKYLCAASAKRLKEIQVTQFGFGFFFALFFFVKGECDYMTWGFAFHMNNLNLYIGS